MSTRRRIITTMASLAIAAIAAFVGVNPAFAASEAPASGASSQGSAIFPAGCSQRSYKVWGESCTGFSVDVINSSPFVTRYARAAGDGVATNGQPVLQPKETSILKGADVPFAPSTIDAKFNASPNNDGVLGYDLQVITDYSGKTSVGCGSIVLFEHMKTIMWGHRCHVSAAGQVGTDDAVTLTNPSEHVAVTFE